LGAQAVVTEGSAIHHITINMSQPSDTLVKVNFDLAGSALGNKVDYWTVPADAVTFNSGETTKDLQIYFYDDTINEPFEDLSLSLAQVVLGSAGIDSANKNYQITIQDNDSAGLFLIEGITGGGDIKKDAYLTSGSFASTSWTQVPNASEYRVSVLNSNNSVYCTAGTLSGSVNSVSLNQCALVEAGNYKIQVEVATTTGSSGPQNTVQYAFQVDTILPSSFDIVGVMGYPDVSPDNFLAGTVNPTVVWIDSSTESNYLVSVLSQDGTLVVCAEVSVPPNVTAYTFDQCTLQKGSFYRLQVKAVDNAGNTRLASNNFLQFLVTEVPGGYIIQGVTGGVTDTTIDNELTDGVDPVLHWDAANGTSTFDVSIFNLDGSLKCEITNIPGAATQITFTGCSLSLHQEYDVRVVAKDANNIAYPAANSPFRFRHKVGLFISGTASDKSYFKGVTITSCGGVDGSLCNSTTPFLINEDFFEKQIRVYDNGAIAGVAYNPANGAFAVDNGILKIRTDYLRVDNGAKITMQASGYPAANGPGKGTNGNPASGAAHGGLSFPVTAGSQALQYGSSKSANTAGSGGGSNGANLGGAGGGIIDIQISQDLYFFNGSIEAPGADTTALNAGGGAGGSVNVVTQRILGAGGRFRAPGGNGNGSGTGGAGGRIALNYTTMLHSGDILGLTFDVSGGLNPGTNYRGASGTTFYKKSSDAYGYLLTENSTHTQGVETPIDLTETFDAVITKSFGTFIVPESDSYTLLTNTLNYRLVVAGTLNLPPANAELIIASGGRLEWRRADVINANAAWTGLTIQYGGSLTHSKNDATANPFYKVELSNFDSIKVFGNIDTTGKGYPATFGPGASSGRYGASYAGLGGRINAGSLGSTYGRIVDADYLGSGGGGGSGGGFIKITRGSSLNTNLELRGLIRSAGTSACGAGSGGSIYIDVVTFSGSGGQLSVLGGDGVNCGTNDTAGASGSGGGGRIAVFYASDSFDGGLMNLNYETYGGNGGTYNRDGAAGTVFLKNNGIVSPDANGHLLVFNGSRRYYEDTTTLLTAFDESLLLDSIHTDASAILHLPSSFSTFELPNALINYRLISEGDFTFNGGAGGHLQIKYGGYLEWRKLTPLNVQQMTIDQGGVLTHTRNTTTKNYIVNLNVAGDLSVNGLIDAEGRGYARDQGPGKGTAAYIGAGHGGRGGVGSNRTTALPGAAYNTDKVKSPDELGSGSLTLNGNPGAAGGGMIQLNAGGNLNINGTLSVDGGAGACDTGNTNCTAGGSGGSIYIIADQVSGSGGIISADGGNGGDGATTDAYHGGGGRIAIIYNTDNVLSGGLFGRLQAQLLKSMGGTTLDYRSGAAGSIFLKQGIANGIVYCHNGGNQHIQKVETPVSDGLIFDDMVTLGNAFLLVPSGGSFTLPTQSLTQKWVIEGSLVYSLPYSLTLKKDAVLEWRQNSVLELTHLTIESGGLLTHSYNLGSETYGLKLNILGNLNLLGGGLIAVDDKGLQAGSRPSGLTGNQGYVAGASGAYGGSTISTAPYGSFSAPNQLGSGGAQCAGAGLVKIDVAGSMLLNGSITANAVSCSGTAETGSGGSIFITTGTLDGGTGKLQANGGYSQWNGSSGGRIALHYAADIYGTSNLSATAIGGGHYQAAGKDGGAGTIYFKNTSNLEDILIIKNTGRIYDERLWTELPNNQNIGQLQVDSSSSVIVRSGSLFHLPSSSINYRLILEGTGDIDLPASGGTLVIANQGVLELRKNKSTFFPPTGSLITKITVMNGGVITHSSHDFAGGTDSYGVYLRLNDLDLYGNIDANAKGFYEAYGPGPGVAAQNTAAGACHGGYGHIAGAASQCLPYDSIINPVDLGSGGGHDTWNGGVGGRGGGRVRLEISNHINLNGKIYTDGQSGLTGAGSGGSGGTINIQTQSIGGSGGLMQARGGNRAGGGGNGSGGRIALAYVSDNYVGGIVNLSIKVEGGTDALYPGSSGTIFLNKVLAPDSIPFGTAYPFYSADTQGHMIINNGLLPYAVGAETYISENLTFDSATNDILEVKSLTGLYIKPGVNVDFSSSLISFPLRVAGTFTVPNGDMTLNTDAILTLDINNQLQFNNLILEPGSKITHGKNTSTPFTRSVNLKVNNLMHIKTGSSIEVSGLGYNPGNGPGSLGGLFQYGGAGASHGGLGGGPYYISTTLVIQSPAAVYPSASYEPTQPGSGGVSGRNGNAAGASGGGFVKIDVAGTFTFEGFITANGSDVSSGARTNWSGDYYSGGAGSGGGVSISAATLGGYYGVISANGGTVDTSGTCQYCGGGGGGGRIFLRYNSNQLNSFSYSAVGGSGRAQGTDGTYLEVVGYP
jgi:hypothetical protein